MLTVALSWGGWWCLRGFGPRSDDVGPDGEENPGQALYVPAEPEKPGQEERGIDLSDWDADPAAASTQSQGRPEAPPEPGPPKPIPGSRPLPFPALRRRGTLPDSNACPASTMRIVPAAAEVDPANRDIRSANGPTGRQAGQAEA